MTSRRVTLFPYGNELVRVRVSGPMVNQNKGDNGDRPCMWVFFDGEEFLAHEVEFSGRTLLLQDFRADGGCPVTGAVLWLETSEPVTVTLREQHGILEVPAHRHDADGRPIPPK